MRSWGNSLDFNFIKDAIAPLVEGRKIYSIGNSMGAFNAIISTHYIPTDVCIAFVPQYSVDPSVVPWEKRWAEYTSEIKRFRFDRADEYMNSATNYFIFTGGEGADKRHAKLFPVMDNIFHCSFSGISHNVAQELKKIGVLDRVVQSCFDRKYDLPENLKYEVLSPEQIEI